MINMTLNMPVLICHWNTCILGRFYSKWGIDYTIDLHNDTSGVESFGLIFQIFINFTHLFIKTNLEEQFRAVIIWMHSIITQNLQKHFFYVVICCLYISKSYHGAKQIFFFQGQIDFCLLLWKPLQSKCVWP